ncbi:hypothetical protein M5E89_07955 [Acidaminococcus intestini]|nr:hypothetical protein M5E89_07955 [Acidaminococcus intestini]
MSIMPGDTVIISATPIPGNERGVGHTIDNLYKLGAEVVYGREQGIHVSGHASQEEIKMMHRLIRPKFLCRSTVNTVTSCFIRSSLCSLA